MLSGQRGGALPRSLDPRWSSLTMPCAPGPPVHPVQALVSLYQRIGLRRSIEVRQGRGGALWAGTGCTGCRRAHVWV